MKNGLIFVAALMLVLLLPVSDAVADDPIDVWRKQAEKKFGTSLQKELAQSRQQKILPAYRDEILGIGAVEWLEFQACCEDLSEIVYGQMDVGQSTKLSFISYDFNGDGARDFVARTQPGEGCLNKLCPTFLFVQNTEKTYTKHDGPDIWGDKVAVKKEDEGTLKDLVYYDVHWWECTWSFFEQKNLSCQKSRWLQKHDPRRTPNAPAVSEISMHHVALNGSEERGLDSIALLLIDKNNIDVSSESEIYISEAIAFSDSEPVYILSIQDRMSCGTRGCETAFFKKDGEQYIRIPTYLFTHFPIYQKNCYGKYSVVLSPAGGNNSTYNEWVYEAGELKHYKKYLSLEESAVCRK